jgi:hypothetical protein
MVSDISTRCVRTNFNPAERLISPDLTVVLDNSTRWNSTYLSITRALLLKERINTFCYQHRDEVEKDRLNDDDWVQLGHIGHGLHAFYEVTLHLEGTATYGHHGAI